MQITEEQRDQYRNEGYLFLENAIPAEQVEGLRQECQRYIDRYDAEMEAKGVTVQGINHYKKRYFISRRGLESPTIKDFLFGERMAAVCQATLGETAYLFHEQYVVKFAEVGTKFGWHQDSGYVGHDHRPYLSLLVRAGRYDSCERYGLRVALLGDWHDVGRSIRSYDRGQQQ